VVAGKEVAGWVVDTGECRGKENGVLEETVSKPGGKNRKETRERKITKKGKYKQKKKKKQKKLKNPKHP